MAFLVNNYGVSLFLLFSMIGALWVCLLVSRHYRQMELVNCESLGRFEEELNERLKEIDDHSYELNTWSGFKKFKVKSKTVESMMKRGDDYLSDICSFELIPIETPYPLPEFKAGQHLSFQLNINGEKVVKYYSLSDGPNAYSFRVSIRRALAPKSDLPIPDGVGSNFFHDHIHEGDLIDVALPKGEFYLSEDNEDKTILVCGGIGITPMISMAKDLLQKDSQREVRLYYGVKSPNEVVLKEDLIELAKSMPNFHCYICISNPREDMQMDIRFERYPKIQYITDLTEDMIPEFNKQGEGCRVSVDLMKNHIVGDDEEQSFYLCGPPAMMSSMLTQLYDWGIKKEKVHWEGFGPCAAEWPGDVLNSSLKPCTVVLQKTDTGQTQPLEWKPENGSIMTLADYHPETKGMIPRTCGQGFCGSCKVQCLGDVHYDKEPSYASQLKEGECLPCVCKPIGDVVLKV